MSERDESELAAAVEAVRQAARICQAVQADLAGAVLEKQDRSPVTVADFGSQAVICAALRAAFPADPVVAEEDSAQLREPGNAHLLDQVVARVRMVDPAATAATACAAIDHGGASEYSARFWTLDPIDGTKGFLRGQQYTIALALVVEGQVAAAVLGCPNLAADPAAPLAERRQGSLFTAVVGQGARVQPLDAESPPQPVRVSPTADPAAIRFCESVESAHTAHGRSADIATRLGLQAEPVRLDSQVKYAAVASGRAEAYLRLPKKAGYVEKIWDHAAGVLAITEAGGQVTDVNGAPLEFSRGARLEANLGVVASNGAVHAPLLAAVKATG